MAASITCPTFSPECADATVKIDTQKESPAHERAITSGRVLFGGMMGTYSVPGGSGLYAFSGSDGVPWALASDIASIVL
jgi:hypothetical protein